MLVLLQQICVFMLPCGQWSCHSLWGCGDGECGHCVQATHSSSTSMRMKAWSWNFHLTHSSSFWTHFCQKGLLPKKKTVTKHYNIGHRFISYPWISIRKWKINHGLEKSRIGLCFGYVPKILWNSCLEQDLPWSILKSVCFQKPKRNPRLAEDTSNLSGTLQSEKENWKRNGTD